MTMNQDAVKKENNEIREMSGNVEDSIFFKRTGNPMFR